MMDLSDPIFRGKIGHKLQSHLSNQSPKFKAKGNHKIHSNCNQLQEDEKWLLDFHKPPTASGILTNTPACKAAVKEQDAHTVIWDSGASVNVSFDGKDFVGKIEKLPKGSVIKGTSNGLKIEGCGEAVWSLKDSQGNSRQSQSPCCCIP